MYLWIRYYGARSPVIPLRVLTANACPYHAGLIAYGLNLWLFNANFTVEQCKSLHYIIAATCMWVTLGSGEQHLLLALWCAYSRLGSPDVQRRSWQCAPTRSLDASAGRRYCCPSCSSGSAHSSYTSPLLVCTKPSSLLSPVGHARRVMHLASTSSLATGLLLSRSISSARSSRYGRRASFSFAIIIRLLTLACDRSSRYKRGAPV